MKKIIFALFSALMMCMMTACGGSKATEQDNIGITDREYCNQLRRHGAPDAHIDRNAGALLYGVRPGSVADPKRTAKLMWQDAYNSGIRGIDECRVVELPSGNVIGRYKH